MIAFFLAHTDTVLVLLPRTHSDVSLVNTANNSEIFFLTFHETYFSVFEENLREFILNFFLCGEVSRVVGWGIAENTVSVDCTLFKIFFYFFSRNFVSAILEVCLELEFFLTLSRHLWLCCLIQQKRVLFRAKRLHIFLLSICFLYR